MLKIILAIIFATTGSSLFAQHVQYSGKKKPAPAARSKSSGSDSVVYHEWPDRCPAISGSIPVLTNYVPGELVLKLTEIFKGHLYSITSLAAGNGKLKYKLQVCVKGELVFEFADDNGVIISK